MPKTETLLAETVRLLKKDPRNLAEIARLPECVKANIGYFWLRKVKSGATKNPGIRQVEALRAALSK